MLTAPNLQTANEARQRIADGEPFADVAVEISSDISAARGGLLEPVCRSDARYPDALRQTAFALAPGELSAPVLIGSQFAILQIVRVTEPTAWFLEEHRDEVARVARLTQERLLMERLARNLLGRVSITFFDDSIRQRYRALMREGTGAIDTAAGAPH
jgi:parvulin-like peptidyl-prolyl isomerase